MLPTESELFYSAKIQHSVTMVMYKKEIINADMEAPIKFCWSPGKIKRTDHRLMALTLTGPRSG